MVSRTAIWSLVGISMLFFASVIALAGDEQLYGTWRLVSFTNTAVGGGETTEPYGKSPTGFINYGPDHRFVAVIMGDKRPKPVDLFKMTDQEAAALLKTMVAYGGTYSYDGKILKVHIDMSWIELLTGTDQVREVKIDGNKLILATLPVPGPPDGKPMISTATWEHLR